MSLGKLRDPNIGTAVRDERNGLSSGSSVTRRSRIRRMRCRAARFLGGPTGIEPPERHLPGASRRHDAGILRRERARRRPAVPRTSSPRYHRRRDRVRSSTRSSDALRSRRAAARDAACRRSPRPAFAELERVDERAALDRYRTVVALVSRPGVIGRRIAISVLSPSSHARCDAWCRASSGLARRF